MHITARMEQYSHAYVHAIASVAGFATYRPSVDNDSVDLGLAQKGGKGTIKSPRLELQLKSTSEEIIQGDQINYPLKLKNYNDLRGTDFHVPRILVVVLVPDHIDNWMQQTEECLSLCRCGYWVSLYGEPATTNKTSITIPIPKRNLFSATTLQGLMKKIENKEIL